MLWSRALTTTTDWLTPFHYLLEGLLGAVTHNIPIECEDDELARFSAPPGETCASYTDAFVAEMGGYVQTGANGLCELCQYKSGDEYAASFNVYYSHRWLDVSPPLVLMWV